jgi:CheY-like chemotaxis protein
MRILITTPEPLVQKILGLCLGRCGHEPLAAGSAVDALARIEETGGALDVLVADTEMQPTGGLQLVRRVRERYPHIRGVLITSYADGLSVGDLRDLERCACLRKPIRLVEFLALIEEFGREGIPQPCAATTRTC